MAKPTSKRRPAKPDAYPRDLAGYGARLPDPKWPGGARLALQFSLNYEAGGELSILHGDKTSEALLTDIGAPAVAGARAMLTESAFEYGSRRGVWRLLRLFAERDMKIGLLGVATALARTPDVAAACVEAGHEIVSHHYRWIDYQHVPLAVERRHVQQAVEILTELAGTRPVGWMTGRPGPNTRQLLVEEGASSTTATQSTTNCRTGRQSPAASTSSFRIRSRSTTIAATARRALRPRTTSSRIFATRLTCSTAKARASRA